MVTMETPLGLSLFGSTEESGTSARVHVFPSLLPFSALFLQYGLKILSSTLFSLDSKLLQDFSLKTELLSVFSLLLFFLSFYKSLQGDLFVAEWGLGGYQQQQPSKDASK